MYLILAYDIREERVSRVLKIARKYLNWIQNSLLEGEITSAKFARLKSELKKVINQEEDSIIFYKLRTDRYLKRETLGKEEGKEEKFI